MQNTMATDVHRYIEIALLSIRKNPKQSSQSASHYQDAYFENDVFSLPHSNTHLSCFFSSFLAFPFPLLAQFEVDSTQICLSVSISPQHFFRFYPLFFRKSEKIFKKVKIF
jgi:hypothetical protein